MTRQELLKTENERLDKKFSFLQKDYEDLHLEASRIAYLVEKKDYDINALRAQIKDLTQDRTKPYVTTIEKLKRECQDVQKEKERFYRLWLDSQNEVMKCKETLQSLSTKNKGLDVRLILFLEVSNSVEPALGG